MHVEKMYVEFKCMFKYVCLCWITSMLKKVHVVIKYVQKKCMLICVMFNYLYVEFCYVELFACWIQVCWKMCRSNPLCRSNQTPPIRLISQNLVEKSFLADCNYWQCLTWYCSCRITVLLQQTSDLLTVCAISRIKSALEFSIMHLVAVLLSKSSCRAIWAFPNQKALQTFSFSGWGLLSIGLIRR